MIFREILAGREAWTAVVKVRGIISLTRRNRGRNWGINRGGGIIDWLLMREIGLRIYRGGRRINRGRGITRLIIRGRVAFFLIFAVLVFRISISISLFLVPLRFILILIEIILPL
jgi:hypothetical protein